MDIGNLLNDPGQSPTSKSLSLPDIRSMSDDKARRDVAPERHSLPTDINPSAPQPHPSNQPANYAPHQQYAGQYQMSQMQPYAQLPTGYASYPPHTQSLNALPSPPRANGSVTSNTSDPRYSGMRQGSEGDAKDPSIPKNFTCSTPSCGKAFARRSDLVRHERIHSGVRPHKCPWPYCTKQFIQRSALTVHERVHSGEKPHMCEKCSKQFSDSSSLARHRRIHSGKRPYKCPFPDCQKTFTRRTTLTRHQSNHTSTMQEASAAHAAALATHASHASVDTSEHLDRASTSASPPGMHQHQAQYQNGQGPSQGYYAPALPALGQVSGSSAASSRTPSAVSSYRAPASGSAFEQPSSQVHDHTANPHGTVAPPNHGYPPYADHRYAPPSYQPAYYQQHQHLRHPANHDNAYDPQSHMGVTWTQSMS